MSLKSLLQKDEKKEMISSKNYQYGVGTRDWGQPPNTGGEDRVKIKAYSEHNY